MSNREQLSIRLPDEFVQQVLEPWQGALGVSLMELMVRTLTESLPAPASGGLLERNREWRNSYKERFAGVFREISSGEHTAEMRSCMHLFVQRIEAWMCVTSKRPETGPSKEELEQAAFGENFVSEVTEQAMRQVRVRFGSPRHYRTAEGLDSYYQRVQITLKEPAEASHFVSLLWAQSGWHERLRGTVISILSQNGLITNIEEVTSIKKEEAL